MKNILFGGSINTHLEWKWLLSFHSSPIYFTFDTRNISNEIDLVNVHLKPPRPPMANSYSYGMWRKFDSIIENSWTTGIDTFWHKEFDINYLTVICTDDHPWLIPFITEMFELDTL